jgi:hypothetical protein
MKLTANNVGVAVVVVASLWLLFGPETEAERLARIRRIRNPEPRESAADPSKTVTRETIISGRVGGLPIVAGHRRYRAAKP